MKLWRLAQAFLSLVVMSFSSYSFAFQEINNSVYFPRVAQGHGSCSDAPNPQFTQNNSAKITGTGGQALAFCSSNLGAGLPSDGCDGQQCVVTGNLSTPSLSLTGQNSFPNWNSNESIECSNTQSTSINTLNQVNLTSGCELTFLPNNNGYRIKNFQLNQNAKAILTSGDYWFESANFVQNSQLIIDGDVRIFILGNTEISGSQLNATSTGNLTIVAYGRISLNNQSIVNGYIYAADQLTLNNNSVLNGRVTAKQLTMSGSSRINQFEQQGYTCFTDDFNRSSLGQNWVPFTSSGNFTPSIVSDRLRLTEAVNNQATAVTYQRIFPAANNLVQVELDYYAWANLTGNGADGISLIFSDATVTPRTGGFGGSLGYAPRTDATPAVPGFAGGWLGIGLDEWGNFANPTEGRVGGVGFIPQSITVRGSQASNYQYLTHQTVSPKIDLRPTNTPGPGDRYLIEIDSRNANQVLLSIRRTNNNTTTTILNQYSIPLNQQGAIPEEFFLSLAGSTGGSVNHHEIDNFRVCALNSRPVGPQINHFRITLPQQALTCDVAEVSVKACANGDCSSSFTEPVTANLKPKSLPGATGGWVNGSTLSFNNGIGQAQLRRNQAGPVEVGVLGSNPTAVAFNNTKCSYNGSDFSEANCVVEFVDSGFVLDVPHAYANQLVTGTITALSKGDNPKQCIPSFASVDKDVSLWSKYLIPSGGQGFLAMNVVVDGSAISNNSESPSHRSLYFDQNGQAEFELTYREAGSLALHASFTGTDDEQDLQLQGETIFVRVPKALIVRAENYHGEDQLCDSDYIECGIFARAGEDFKLTISPIAYSSNDDHLPISNFEYQGLELSNEVVAPAKIELGGRDGQLNNPSYDHQLGDTTTIWRNINEVGVFQFSMKPPTDYWLTESLSINLVEEGLEIEVVPSGPIGRFIPAYFAVSPMTVTLAAACSTGGQPFTYLGQPFGYANNPGLYLQPKSGSGSDTLNYLIGDWWRYNNQWAERAYHHAVDDNDFPIDFTNELIAPVSRQSSSTNGVILNGEQLRYQKPIDPMVPFNADFNLQLSINDLRDSDDVCYRTSYSEDCLGYTFENIDQTMPLYWGRLTIEDVFGPETQGLEQPIYVERYTSNGFVRTTEDNCTALPAITGFILQSDDYVVVTEGSAVPPQVLAEHTAGNFAQGKRIVRFSAPGAGVRGVIDTMLNLDTHNLMWLAEPDDEKTLEDQPWQYYFKDSTQGQVQFGLYRGNDRVIWWRETN
ncbi:DUF6701 domain-containing protein [Vibrio metschnikovii]|uniref:DUF6701 domain-containing protein n=1 Tax=Vibrio metschnikovii TaxID=28172 RepID=UPI003BAD741B